jgi:hypothetical protein
LFRHHKTQRFFLGTSLHLELLLRRKRGITESLPLAVAVAVLPPLKLHSTVAPLLAEVPGGFATKSFNLLRVHRSRSL